MRITLTFLASLLLASNFGRAQQQNSDESCGFVLEEDTTHPTIKGPDDIVPLVYVVEQPDSPVEVLSVDLDEMSLSISNEQHTERDCLKYTIRNRGNRIVQKFTVMFYLSTAGAGAVGTGTPSSSPLAPGQTVEITNSCGANGSGGAPNNYVRLLVYVYSVDFGDCYYKPSIRVPRSLNITFLMSMARRHQSFPPSLLDGGDRYNTELFR